MPLTLVTPPTNDPVCLEEAKDHLRVDHNTEDALILSLITTATRRLDGRDGSLGRCLIEQTWSLSLDRFPAEIVLPLPPCISVGGITYLASDGDMVLLPAADYRVTGLGTMEGARIRPAQGKSWPATSSTESVLVEFTAGFGGAADDVPAPLRTAILLHVSHLYEHRESVTTSEGATRFMPHGYEDLVRDFRHWAF